MDLEDVVEMKAELAKLSDRVVNSLEKKELLARTVTIKVRYSDFSLVTRSHTLERAGCDRQGYAERAAALLDRTDAARRPVRLLGVGVHGLSAKDAAPQAAHPEQLLLE